MGQLLQIDIVSERGREGGRREKARSYYSPPSLTARQTVEMPCKAREEDEAGNGSVQVRILSREGIILFFLKSKVI